MRLVRFKSEGFLRCAYSIIASAQRLQQESKPDAIQVLDHQIMTIQIELESLRKESDVSSVERRARLQEEFTTKAEEVARLTQIWEKEKSSIASIKSAKEELEKARLHLDQAQREGDYAKASKLRYSTIPYLEELVPDERAEVSATSEYKDMLIHDSVTSTDIEAVVSRQTGIPVTKLMSDEIEKLINMEETLIQSVRGQDEAIAAVANSVRVQRAGLSGENKPIASFLLLGESLWSNSYLSVVYSFVLRPFSNAQVSIPKVALLTP